jgi:hypothetical protein
MTHDANASDVAARVAALLPAIALWIAVEILIQRVLQQQTIASVLRANSALERSFRASKGSWRERLRYQTS